VQGAAGIPDGVQIGFPWVVTAPIDQVLLPALIWIDGTALEAGPIWLPAVALAAVGVAGYAHFLGTQIDADDAVVFVAERDGTAIGYVYAGIEPFSWKELRDAAGFVHDIVVDQAERRTGVAGALMDAAIAWVREQDVASVMLWTAAPNEGAQRLFEGLGFRRTMIEMTRDL